VKLKNMGFNMTSNLNEIENILGELKNGKKILEYLLELRNKYEERLNNLRSEFKLAEEDYQALDQLVLALKKAQFAKILDLRDSMDQIFKRISISNPIFSEFLDKIFKIANDECQKISMDYPILIQEACQQEGIKIDQTSVHPKYTFCDQFITLEIDEKKFKAKAYTREGKLFVLPFDISIVIPAIKEEIKRIFGRTFNPNQFLKKLYSNYCKIIEKEKKQIGDPIPIRKITSRLGKTQKNFRTDEFVVDLSKLIKEGIPSDLGYKIELGHTKDDRSGILLHGFESHGYVGFISIKKEN
jgi:hypothetical protein